MLSSADGFFLRQLKRINFLLDCNKKRRNENGRMVSCLVGRLVVQWIGLLASSECQCSR